MQETVQKERPLYIVGEMRYLPHIGVEVNGFLLCDGSPLSINDYPQLYNVIGNLFGGSHGVFKLPNLINKTVAAWSEKNPQGTIICDEAEKVTLKTENLPPHKHFGITNKDAAYKTPKRDFKYLVNFNTTNPFTVGLGPVYTTQQTPYCMVGGSNLDTAIDITDEHQHQIETDMGYGLENKPFDNRQPTAYVGRWYMYAGE